MSTRDRLSLTFRPDPGANVQDITVRLSKAVSELPVSEVKFGKAAPEAPQSIEAIQEQEPCQECADGHLTVYSSKRRGSCVVQYVQCWACKWKPDDNRRVQSADDVPRRRNRKNRPTKVQPNFEPEA